jgi:hypothetical protein
MVTALLVLVAVLVGALGFRAIELIGEIIDEIDPPENDG